MNVKQTMRLGVVGSYPTPPGLEGMAKAEWLIKKSAELGLTAFGFSRGPEDLDTFRRLGELARSQNVELEYGFPREVFHLAGEGAKEAREGLIGCFRKAQALGTNLIRTGYGRLEMATSRFNRDWPLQEHIQTLTRSLKEAAKIAEDEGMLLAIENHCDFTGEQLAGILAAVDSANVGAALDTGNGYTVFCDPHDDVRHLAPWTITTHIKDMEIIRNPNRGVPFVAVGCALGEGHVDILWVIDELARNCPRAEGLHLIIETGWVPFPPDQDRDPLHAAIFHRSIDLLQEIIA